MERDKDYNVELAKYIWSILKYNPPVLMSWGVDLDTIKVIDRGLQFHVQGFLLTGNVVIVYNEVRVYNNVALDGLVDLIDSKVEKTDEYEKRVSDTYDT